MEQLLLILLAAFIFRLLFCMVIPLFYVVLSLFCNSNMVLLRLFFGVFCSGIVDELYKLAGRIVKTYSVFKMMARFWYMIYSVTSNALSAWARWAFLVNLQFAAKSCLHFSEVFFLHLFTVLIEIYAYSSIHAVFLTLTVLNFRKFTSYCSLKPLWSGMGEVVPAHTSPTLHPPSPPTVHQLS